MAKYRVNGEVLVVGKSHEEVSMLVAKSSALIKTVVGVGNNAAWACCLEALDHLREHPNYRHRVKQGFKAAMEAFKAYERQLIYAQENRLFTVADLTPECRKRYGNITNREYYDFWANTGAQTYATKRVWATSLWNKFRLSLINHDVSHADLVAWGMTADAVLTLAEYIYDNSIKTCVSDYGIPSKLLEAIFGQLKVTAIERSWAAALNMLEPRSDDFELTEAEQRNIQLGLDQLQEYWTDVDTLADSLTGTIEAYDEVFRTKGEQKKALKRVAEMRD